MLVCLFPTVKNIINSEKAFIHIGNKITHKKYTNIVCLFYYINLLIFLLTV